jgi:hypothetical protein
LWDGLFHATTYAFVVLGLIVLWRASRRSHIRWSSKLLVGSLLMGFGIFNLVEGVVDHHLLGIHHVNETVPRQHWIYWDVGFLAWGAAMLIGGWFVLRAGRRETRDQEQPQVSPHGRLASGAGSLPSRPAGADGSVSAWSSAVEGRARDQPGAAAVGQPGPHPVHEHGEPIAEPDQQVDVQEAPEQPRDVAGIGHRGGAADGRHGALVA